MGSIKIIFGCMYSGKTTDVIRESKKWSSISKKAICINYAKDTRYGDDDQLYSHDLNNVECVRATNLSDIDDDVILSGDMILINEGQFFTDLIECCVKWCETYGKNIIVSGLDGDYKRRPFGQMLDLIPYADSVEKISAFCKKCSDGTPAYFTWRLSNENEQIVIGSTNYIPVCRKHYTELSKK